MALVLLGVFTALWVVGRLGGLIFMVFIALFTSVALEPAVLWLTGRGWNRRRATQVVFLGTTLLVVGFVAALVPLFVSQATALLEDLPAQLESLQELAGRIEFLDIELLDEDALAEFQDIEALLGRFGGSVAGGVFALSNTLISAIFQGVTILLFAYYMIAEGPRMRRTVLGVFPQERQREILRIWEIAVQKTGGYIYSRLILSVVAAGFTALVLVLLDLPYVAALGLWVGVISQFVPVVGTYIAAVLPVLVALADAPVKALWVLVALVAYQQLENYVVAPRITAKAMAIHPAISVGAVIAGAALLGGVGAVLALPVAATIQALVSTSLERHEVITREAEDGADSA